MMHFQVVAVYVSYKEPFVNFEQRGNCLSSHFIVELVEILEVLGATKPHKKHKIKISKI